MLNQLKIAPRLDVIRNISVAFLCLYYYVSILRPSEATLGVDIDLIARCCLIVFLLLAILRSLASYKGIFEAYYRHKARWIIAIACVTFFTVVSGEPWLLVPFILYVMYIDSDLKTLARKFFVFSSIFFVSIAATSVVLKSLGRDTVDKSYSFISFLGTNANSIGFENSNQPLLYFFLIAVNGAFLYTNKKHRRIYALIMIIIAILLFAVTLSITGLMCTMIFLLTYAFVDKKSVSIIRRLTIVIAVAALVITPYLAVNYGYKDGNRVNESLSMRPYLWNLRVSDGAYFNILGNADKYEGDYAEYPVYTLDNQYLQLIARYGWLALIIVFYVFFPRMYYSENAAITSALFAVSIYSFSESIMYILLLSVLPVASFVAVINSAKIQAKV